MHKILSTCKGGGYMYCRTTPIHPKANSNGLYPLHRVLMEIKLGRYLVQGEEVHHKDEDKSNNDPENLQVLTKAEHTRLHVKKVDNIKLKCKCCGSRFELKPNVFRLRLNRIKSDEVYCSRTCGTKMTYNKKRT